MKDFKIPNRMGAEQLMEMETALFNNNPSGKNTNTKYVILGIMIVASIGVGVYMANQYQKPEKQA